MYESAGWPKGKNLNKGGPKT